MKKLFISLMSIIILLGCNRFSSPASTDYALSEYISTQGIAQPGQETKVELEDGAAIVIPANAIENEVSVKVERNPEKSNNLPPLDENLVTVGDFYNFEIDGEVSGFVDLVLPFNPELVPEDGAGVLVAAIPTENGWKYIPVVPNGNKITLYTDQIGDPLIAWHFACTDRTDLSYVGHPDITCEDAQVKRRVCDPDIALDVVQNGERFEVIGKVLPVAKNFFGGTISEPAANIPVKIILNAGWRGVGQSYSVTTSDDGSFSFSIDQSNGLEEGWNWVFAKAECDPWWGKIVVESNGYAEFKYSPIIVEQPVSTLAPQTTSVATVIPLPTEQPIPTGAVFLPDFVGQSIDDSINWLESNGFKYTWIDGSSTYDLGVIYDQAPAGGQYKVPHRTVVILYRTIEKTEDLYGCSNPNLTLEERSNCGFHEYEVVACRYEGDDYCSCDREAPTRINGLFPFTDSGLLVGNERIGLNTFFKTETDIGPNDTNITEKTIVFNENGFIQTVSHRTIFRTINWADRICSWTREYIILNP